MVYHRVLRDQSKRHKIERELGNLFATGLTSQHLHLSLSPFRKHLDLVGKTLDNGVCRTITTVMFHLPKLGVSRNATFVEINERKQQRSHRHVNHLQCDLIRQWMMSTQILK